MRAIRGAKDVFAEEQLGQDDPEWEEVRAGVGDRVARLLGREILVLPRDDLAFLVIHQVEGLRDAEVRELHVALVGQHDVLGADVAVDDIEMPAVAITLGVGVGEAACDARDDEGREIDRNLAAELPVLLQEVLEIHTPHKFHHHEILSAGLPKVVGLDDVGMDEVGNEPGLADEVILELLDGRILLANQLNGHDLAEIARAPLQRFEDKAHPTLGNLPSHLIVELAEDVFDRRHW